MRDLDLARRERTLRLGASPCEACGSVATATDSDGVPLCDPCMASLREQAASACYICRSDDPTASPEGCDACSRRAFTAETGLLP